MFMRGSRIVGLSPTSPVRIDCGGGFPNRPANGGGPRLLIVRPSRKRSVDVIGKVSHVKFVGNKGSTL